MDRTGQLYEFGTTKSPDRTVRLHVEPCNSLVNCRRATPKLLHRFIQDRFDRQMRMQVLLRREMFKDLIGIHVRGLCSVVLMSLQWGHSAVL